MTKRITVGRSQNEWVFLLVVSDGYLGRKALLTYEQHITLPNFCYSSK